MKSFFRHNRKKIVNIIAVVVIVASLMVSAVLLDRRITGNHSEESPVLNDTVQKTDSSMIIEVSFYEKEMSLVSPAVSAYLRADVATPANEVFDGYRGDDNKRLDYHSAVPFSYRVKGLPDGCAVKSAVLLVADNEKFANAASYNLGATDTEVNLNYLKTGMQYYYRLKVNFSNNASSQLEGSFKTAATPRILSVEGIYNVRDIGGWETASGKRIKQGLLYRGTELDGAVNPQYSIAGGGVNTMLTVLGIRTDMDLRPSSDNKTGSNPLGVGVNHIYYGAPSYMEVYKADRMPAIRAIFADLADKNNYPAYLHCTYGLDRTGTVCYLLEALLGVSEEDLIRDYQLSALHHHDISASYSSLNSFIDQLKTYEGASMQEKAENYLLSCGVTRQEIESIRSIFLAD